MTDLSSLETPRAYQILLVIRHPVGGIRTFCRYVYNRLENGRYHFTLIAPASSETDALLKDLASLRVDYMALPNSLSDADFVRAVARTIRTGEFDLVHSHGFTSGFASVIGSLLRRTPHLLTCHDVFTERQFAGFKGSLRRMGIGLALTRIDRIHCVTNDAQSNLLDYLGIVKLVRHRIHAIRNGIDSAHFLASNARNLRTEVGADEATFLIGFLGRFMSQKGFRYLIDAMETLKKRNDLPRRPMVLAFSSQDGYYREEMAEVQRRRLGDSIRFMPFVPDVAPTLKGLDVVAMPSLWEACGLLAMEAMVAGVPVIGTSCVGLREVLADTPARMIPPRDASALADALLAEMRAPGTAKARSFAPEAATRFSVDAQAKELSRLIGEMVE